MPPMALTAQVKDELSRLQVLKSGERRAEVSALLRFAGGLHIVSGRVVVEAELDACNTARRLRRELAEVYGASSEVLVVAWGGLRSGEAAAPRLAWRPLLVIAGSVALFAVMLDRAGLVLTTAAIVALSRAGRAGHPWRETLLLAGGAALGAALVFRYGLGMQLPLWPDLG